MRFWFVLLGGLALLISACTLNTSDPDAAPTVASTQVSLITPLPSLTPTFTLTPQPTQTSILPTNTRVPAGATLVNCIPRADWVATYTVVTGDTLGKIATLVGSNVAALQQGNCLVDANQIVVGQKLRVPNLPPTVTPTQISGTTTGGIKFSEIISGDAGMVQLLRDSTITVTWENAPAGLANVSFLLVAPGYPNVADTTIHGVIGQLTNPTGAVSVSWTVPAGLNGKAVIAQGQFANSMMLTFSWSLTVYSAPPSGQGCEISPSAGRVNAYMQPDASAQIFGTLDPGQYVEVLGQALNGWYGYDAGAGGTGLARLRWLSIQDAFVKRGNC